MRHARAGFARACRIRVEEPAFQPRINAEQTRFLGGPPWLPLLGWVQARGRIGGSRSRKNASRFYGRRVERFALSLQFSASELETEIVLARILIALRFRCVHHAIGRATVRPDEDEYILSRGNVGERILHRVGAGRVLAIDLLDYIALR